MNEAGVEVLLHKHVLVRAFELAGVDQSLAGQLDPAEKARAATIVDPPTRRDFIAGRAALRLMAAEVLDAAPHNLVSAYSCPDCGPHPLRSHGRPGYLVNGVTADLSISFSRSRGWALAAMVRAAEVPLGVDLQNIAQLAFDGFDDVALSPDEKLLLSRVAPEKRNAWRAAAWARKEALAKYSGLGLRTDPTLINAFPGKTEGVQGSEVDVRDVVSAEVGLPHGFAAAVAVRTRA
ncbi:4'-phosphopantetheinyl transferase family protein [Arthrobacter glacialis]|uniref:4-phosphopantetheinyl transferase n=1 Tax=Arthrobacter glacialis TaxID=1664 RepID=A0A2S3ZU45_ARTGL|nr:4'-phosphopantetheinyl transferase superfamily protein [Arthrobacter glacialis]POH72776.1 4-phosphopantetheinyl transferase [Arthrobacter glacialis]